MVRLWLVGGVVAAAFYIYCIVDCALFDRSRVRALPKAVWVLVVILFPFIGGILWFAFGRSRRSSRRPIRRTTAPDDDPDFLKKLGRDRNQEERIKKLEQELAELDDKGDTDPPGRRDA